MSEDDRIDQLNQPIADYLLHHYHRMEFARLWLNEEFFVDDSARKFAKVRNSFQLREVCLAPQLISVIALTGSTLRSMASSTAIPHN